MFSMKNSSQEKDDLISTVFSELKSLGIKIPKVKKFRTNYLKSEKCVQETNNNKIFGVYLSGQEWILYGEYSLPKFVAMSTDYLQNYLSKEVGLFRKAGNVARQKKLRVKLESGEILDECEPNDVASLLKQWLRELPEPLIPPCLQELFIRSLQIESESSRVTACLLMCLLLPPEHLNTFKHLMCFMASVASNSCTNKMGVYNLSLIMAPNIFVMPESSDKIKNDLVQQHTAIVKLLIENCDEIGKIPFGITFNYPTICSDLDSSTDILDTNSTKIKKKRRSGGPVQDIVSGIRRLVGQNNTPVSRNATPENVLKTPLPRSGFKRKADPDLQSLSPTKKQNLSLEDLNKHSFATTPKQKNMLHGSSEKIIGGHVRRKSIGALLRRKDRKRGKSSKMPTEDIEMKCLSPEIQQLNKNETVFHEKLLPRKLDSSNVETDFSRHGSIKKSVSDRLLLPINAEFSVLPSKNVSASQSNLVQQQKVSPYKLRSETQKEDTLLAKEIAENDKVQMKGKEKVICLKESPKKIKKNELISSNIIPNTVSSPGLMDEKSKTTGLNNEVTFYTPKENFSSRRSPRLSVTNNIKLKDNLENEINHFISLNKKSFSSPKLICNNLDETPLKVGLTRQDGFIVKKRKKKPRSSSLKLKNDENCSISSKPKITNRQLGERSTPSSRRQQKSSERKSLRRSRHGSLIRGKPNSTTSGLRSALPRHISHDSALSLNSINKSTKVDEDNLLLASPALQNLDLSLSILLQNFCLSSPNESVGLQLNIGISSDANSSTVSLNISQNEAEKMQNRNLGMLIEDTKNATPLTSNQKRLSNNSDIKSLKLKDFLDLNRSNSFSGNEYKIKIPKSKRSSTDLSQFESFLSPLNSEENASLTLPGAGLKPDDNCFKTPSSKWSNSPDSANWMSGSAFLSTIASPHEEIFNKRESIAMILKNNTGYVQAKVSLYDKNFHNNSFSDSRNSSQGEKSLRSSSQKCHSSNKIKIANSRSTDSAKQSSSVKNRARFQKSPLPPPPKFILTDCNTPSPKINHGLKEVTNLNLVLEDSNCGKSPCKKTNTPIKHLDSPIELKRNSLDSPSKLKTLKRNSFSGHTPYKLTKKVSRSESSPACQRRNFVLRE